MSVVFLSKLTELVFNEHCCEACGCIEHSRLNQLFYLKLWHELTEFDHDLLLLMLRFDYNVHRVEDLHCKVSLNRDSVRHADLEVI